MYTVGSLFTGIGGFDLAFQSAGFSIAYQVEIDGYCQHVLSRHWPDVPKHKDVCAVGTHNLPYADVICGGFPCQDISLAGKRAGIRDGTRSGLWFEMARVIGELRPRIVLLENVAAITTAGGGGTRVIADLAEMGYDARWGIIRASDAGAPHQRARWFCVAYRISAECETRNGYRMGTGKQATPLACVGNLPNTIGARLEEPDTPRQPAHSAQARSGLVNGFSGRGDVDHSDDSGLYNKDNRERGEIYNQDRINTAKEFKRNELESWASKSDHGQAQPGLGRNADGLSYRLDAPRWPAPPGPQHDWEPPRTTTTREHRAARLKALGNAVVPQVVYPLAVMIREWLDQDNN